MWFHLANYVPWQSLRHWVSSTRIHLEPEHSPQLYKDENEQNVLRSGHESFE